MAFTTGGYHQPFAYRCSLPMSLPISSMQPICPFFLAHVNDTCRFCSTKHDLPCFSPSWALHLYILHHLCLSTFSKGQGHHLICHCGSYSPATCRERGHNDSRTTLPCSDPSLRGIPNSHGATNVRHWDAIPKALLTQNDMRIQTNLQIPPPSFNTIQ